MYIIKNMKVRNKILMIIAVSIIVAASIATLSFIQTNKMTSNIEAVYEEKFIPNDWLSNAIAVNLRINSVIIELMMTTDAMEKQELHSEINEGIDQVLSDLALYGEMELTEAEQRGLADFYEAVERLTANQEEVINLAVLGHNERAYELYRNDVKEPREDLIAALQELRAFKVDQTEVIVAESVAAGKTNNTNNVIINGVAIAILVFLGLFIARMVTVPLQQLREQLLFVEQGDFTVKGTYESKDEIGQLMISFNKTFETLRDVVSKVKVSSEHVDNTSQELMANVEHSTTAADHVVASIQEIAAGSEQTRDRLEQNSIVIERVATGFSTIRHNITEVEHLVATALNEAREGSSIVDENVEQMQSIKQSIQRSNDVIQTLSNQVGEVDEILKVIDGISQQTNLLALNAAIEAARAGEHGKGFAVVADEVRKLAEQSIDATKSVASILSNIKEDTAQSVSIMNVVLTEAESGLVATDNTSKKFDDILTNTSEVSPVLHVAKASIEEIVSDFDSFKSGADTILHVSLRNAQNSEMVSAASEQQAATLEDMTESSRVLANVATELNDVVKKFTI
ncbi:MAG: methyl-accepting chemotaxis protein [Caryophanon sp.]|nr:methyl-accepting chemotaxis protein [Caryophanon sp.]